MKKRLFFNILFLICVISLMAQNTRGTLLHENFDNCGAYGQDPEYLNNPAPTKVPDGWSVRTEGGTYLIPYGSGPGSNYSYNTPSIINQDGVKFLVLYKNASVTTPLYFDETTKIQVTLKAKAQRPSTTLSLGGHNSQITDLIISNGDYQIYNVIVTVYSGQYFAFSVPNINTQTVFIDEITVKELDIEFPENPNITNITKTSAVGSCSAVATATSYEWKVGPLGFNPDTQGTSFTGSNPAAINITGLTENTSYDAYVRAKNSSYTSYWSVKRTFTTQGDCALAEGFDHVTDLPVTPKERNLPTGWTYYNDYENALVSKYDTQSKFSPYVFPMGSCPSAPNALRFKFSMSTSSQSTHSCSYLHYSDQYAILPEKENIPLAEMTFSYRFSQSGNSKLWPTVHIGVVENPAKPGSTFTKIASVPKPMGASDCNTWKPITVNFSKYTAAGKHIAIKVLNPVSQLGPSNCGGAHNFFVDNISVTWGVSAPYVERVDNTGVEWTSQGMGNKGKYELVLSTSSLTPEQLEDPDSYGATIHEYPQNTLSWNGTVCPGSYYTYIRETTMDCNNEGWNTNTGPYVINGPTVPTNLVASSVTTTSATISWTGVDKNFEYLIKLNNTPPTDADMGIETTAKSVTINNLQSCTTYYVWVRSLICNTTSNWSEMLSFTSTCDNKTITFINNSSTYTTKSVTQGSTFTFPTYPSIEEGFAAKGWTKTQIPTFQNTPNTSYEAGSTSAAVSSDETYYLQKQLQSDTYYTTQINTVITTNTTYSTDQNLGNVSIADGAVMTINGGLVTTGIIGFKDDTDNAIVINEGGKLLHYNDNVPGKVARHIIGPEDNGLPWFKSKFGWYFISSPLSTSQPISSFIPNTDFDYDLFYWNYNESKWISVKETVFEDDYFLPQKGYIAAYQHTQDFIFRGSLFPYPSDNNYAWNLSSVTAGKHILLGNQFCTDLIFDNFVFDDGIQTGYAIPDPTSATFSYRVGGYIKPREGFMVYSTEDSPSLPYNTNLEKRELPYSKTPYLNITVKNADGADNTILLFNNKTGGFKKLGNYNDKVSLVYFLEDRKAMSITNILDGFTERQIVFSCKQAGEHTISVEHNGDFSYLHLIDRITGNDIDMLLDESYTFTAAPTDNKNRFVVRFVRSGMSLDENVFEDESFVTISDDEIFISGIEGESTIDIFDVMGRRHANIKANNNVTISTSNLKSGVYLVRVLDNNGNKNQKIIIH